jgi:hypothetical protein
MNLALFLALFVFGFFTASSAGVNFWMEIVMLTIFVFVGLNPQQPVATQTIIDAYVAFIIGIAIATIVGRLVWPVLPQMVMRDNLLVLFADLKALLDADPLGEKVQNQLAILPLEAFHASSQIRIAGCTKQEKARLGALIRARKLWSPGQKCWFLADISYRKLRTPSWDRGLSAWRQSLSRCSTLLPNAFVKVIAGASCQASVAHRAIWMAHSKVFARAKY